jgi:hypothetical protein
VQQGGCLFGNFSERLSGLLGQHICVADENDAPVTYLGLGDNDMFRVDLISQLVGRAFKKVSI